MGHFLPIKPLQHPGYAPKTVYMSFSPSLGIPWTQKASTTNFLVHNHCARIFRRRNLEKGSKVQTDMVGSGYGTQSGAFYDNKPDNTGPWDARNKHCKKNYLISPYPCSYSTQTHFQRLKQLRTIHLNPWVMVPFNTSKQHIQGSENFPTKPITIPYHKGNKLCCKNKVFDPSPRC